MEWNSVKLIAGDSGDLPQMVISTAAGDSNVGTTPTISLPTRGPDDGVPYLVAGTSCQEVFGCLSI